MYIKVGCKGVYITRTCKHGGDAVIRNIVFTYCTPSHIATKFFLKTFKRLKKSEKVKKKDNETRNSH